MTVEENSLVIISLDLCEYDGTQVVDFYYLCLEAFYLKFIHPDSYMLSGFLEKAIFLPLWVKVP